MKLRLVEPEPVSFARTALTFLTFPPYGQAGNCSWSHAILSLRIIARVVSEHVSFDPRGRAVFAFADALAPCFCQRHLVGAYD